MSAEQQNINYGASANDGTGDPLRTAFIKTDENFSNIWAAGPVGSNVTITNNTISVINTNGNLVLSPNGVGVVQVNNSVVPRFGNSYDLGTSAAPFRSTHAQGVYAANYYYANGAPFSGGGGSDYGNANVAAYLPTYSGNIGNIRATELRSPAIFSNQVSAFNSTIGNLLANNVSVGNLTVINAEFANVINVDNIVNEFPISITTNTFNGGGSWRFGGNILRGPEGGTWQESIDTIFFTSPANGYVNITSLNNGNVVSEIFMEHSFIRFFVDNGLPEKNWQMNLDGTFDVPGDIIPQSNGTASLGNATNQWGELWVAGNTVYIDSVPIAIGAGNVLTVAGEPVLSNDSNATISTTGNITANYFIGDGSQLTGISISGNSLVNGNNSFVLNSDGNVVFEGAEPGQGVNRGLVWDYGTGVNGVNSEVRQDVAGITVRAWTEGGEGGVYSAPVNIVTNQDENQKTWIFNGEGDLILPGNMILAAGNIRSNTSSPAFNSAITGINSGNANVIITIADGVFEGPASGQVTISGVNPPVQANGEWWYQAVEFDQFQLFTDSSLTTPVDGTEWPGYVDGGTAVGIAEYSNLTIQGGNISITSNDNTWVFDTTGNLTIPNDIVSNRTIDIDNRLSGNSADIRLYSADDILLQARDRTLGSGSEGGDINIYAGDSAEDSDASGGDVQIYAGNGGAANIDFGGQGGFVRIQSGDGGPAIGDGVSVAEDGGDITIQAGSAGDNGGNIDRGAGAGDVFILSGASTGNGISGGNIVISTGTGGQNGAGGVVQIETPSSDRGAGGTWTFGHNGNLTLPNNGNVNGADGQFVRIQSVEEGVVRSGMILNPGDGLTRLESWDNENSESYSTADWTTGEYVDAGGFGQIAFTDAPSIINLVNSVETSRMFLQVNGGAALPYDGYSGSGNNITFFTPVVPSSSPETVTSFTVSWSNRSRIEMDYDEGELNIQARDLDINITSDRSIDIQTRDTIRIENSSNVNGIFIATDTANTFRSWSFDVAGNLNLPLGGSISEGPSPSYLGDAVTITPANGGDPNQQLKIYPTVAEGNHLHLTSGNLAVTDIFLGDDRQYIRTTTTEGMIIGTGGGEIFGGYTWAFDNLGVLTLPGEGILQSVDDTVTLQSFNTSTGNANSVYLGSGGGLGFSDQEIGGNWLEIFRNGAEPQITVPVGRGNLNIQTAQGENAYNWTFDNAGNLTVPGHIVVSGGLVGSGASPAPSLSGFSTLSAISANISGNISGGNVIASGNVTAQNFVGNISITGNVQGTTPNVSLVAGSYTYTFDNAGVMTLPAVSGNEGGEIQFTQAANSTLSGNTVTVDSYVDQIRFFEGGGTSRGVYIDLSQAAAGVGTLLNNRVSAFVDAGTFVTMDNIRATVPSSGNRGLSLATTTGSITYNISGTYGGVGGSSGLSVNAQTLTTTPTGSIFGWNFTAEGEASTYVLIDKTNNRSYRITVSIGPAYLSNMISIERLV